MFLWEQTRFRTTISEDNWAGDYKTDSPTRSSARHSNLSKVHLANKRARRRRGNSARITWSLNSWKRAATAMIRSWCAWKSSGETPPAFDGEHCLEPAESKLSVEPEPEPALPSLIGSTSASSRGLETEQQSKQEDERDVNGGRKRRSGCNEDDERRESDGERKSRGRRRRRRERGRLGGEEEQSGSGSAFEGAREWRQWRHPLLLFWLPLVVVFFRGKWRAKSSDLKRSSPSREVVPRWSPRSRGVWRTNRNGSG